MTNELRDSLDHAIHDMMSTYEQAFARLQAVLVEIRDSERMLRPSLALFQQLTGSAHLRSSEFGRLFDRGLAARGGPSEPSRSAVDSQAAEQLHRLSEAQVDPPPRPPESGRIRQVFDVVSAAGRALPLTEIADALSSRGLLDDVENREAATAAILSRSVRLGLLVRPRRGEYMVAEGVTADD